MTSGTAIIITGALAGGFVSGLTGFGTGMTALVLWLHVLPAMVAGPLVVICSVAGQLIALPSIWHAVDVKRLLPFVIPGLIGIPLGTWLLTWVALTPFKFWVGAVIAFYSAIILLGHFRPTIAWGGRFADGIVGWAGGVLGGLAGLSGLLPTIWASVRGWGKDERRAVFQGFNLTILGATLIAHAAAGLLTPDVGHAALIALPGTLAGSALGQHIYRRLDDHRFDRVVLAFLGVAGALLMWSGI